MSLNTKTDVIKVGGYTGSHIDKGVEEYNKLEQLTHTNNVLASAKSMEELRKAYPNYFGDVRGFLQALTKYF